MQKIKLILIVSILVIIGFFVVYGAINFFGERPINDNALPEISLPDLAMGDNPDIAYSFYNDRDNDGLSDAKEIIYGSNYDKDDTDNDGYQDGEEVKNGYDPAIAGSVKIANRKTKNITIKYFSWVQKKYKVDDPILKESSIREYLDLKFPQPVELPAVQTDTLIITRDNDPEILRNYIAEINNIKLPQSFTNYSGLYEKTLAGEKIGLNEILKELDASIKKLYNTRVPEKALEIHKKYIGIMETLRIIFADLENTQKDPVLIKLNIKKGQELAIIASGLEEEKMKLIK